MTDSSLHKTIQALGAISTGHPGDDGIRLVAQHSLHTAELVDDRIKSGQFAEPAFASRLIVRTAQSFLDAARRMDAGAPVPPAWRPLANRRREPRVDPIQFTLAGANAQINHDAPHALVGACDDITASPYRPDIEHDFQQFSELLGQPVTPLRQTFLDDHLVGSGRPLTPLADLIAHFSITRARHAAWANGLTLWQIASVDALARTFHGTLAEMTALVSAQLLVSFADPLADTQPLSEEMLSLPLDATDPSDQDNVWPP